MAPGGIRLAVKAWLFFSVLAVAFGSYVIMIPKRWELGGVTQVCIVVDDPSAPAGALVVSATAERYKHYRPLYPSSKPDYEEEDPIVFYLPPTTITIPSGKAELCEDLLISDSEWGGSDASVSIKGTVAGFVVNRTANVRFGKANRDTIIQADKYLYQPGQMVKFRILTHFGPLMKVSKDMYPEVWVTTPSHTRIAQWRNVVNPGLVHLEMQLADEPEEGTYRIRVAVDEEKKTIATSTFRVEEYVLPRYEVTIEPPKYVLSRDDSFSFKVCAKYTFGQPVKGDLSLRINNNGYRKCQVDIVRNETFSGCQEFEVLSSQLRMVDCRVNSVYISATLAEEGTGVELGTSKSIYISRRAVSFKTLYNDRYMKYNLPYNLKLLAEAPDGSPAGGVAVEMCYDGSCKNITTPEDGVIKIHVMNFDSRRVIMKNLVSRADMNDDSFSTEIERYYSPSNSSLMINAPEGELKCTPGEETEHNLQVLFSTPDLSSAKISVQVIARSRIQFWSSEEYDFNPSELPFEEEYRMASRPTSSGSGKTGVINIPLRVPITAAPTAWVLVWYIREDGEVVSDSRELKMERCLPNKVNMQWSASKVQPGEEASLTLSAKPGSLCSIGVVDKSVELLTPRSHSLTLDTFFSGIGGSWWRGRSQINDYVYCRDKYPSTSGSYYTDYVDALKMFDDSGVFVFSDLHLETRPCEKHEYPARDKSPSRGDRYPIMSADVGRHPGIVMSASEDHFSEESMIVNEEVTITEEDTSTDPRTEFPETWLWDLVYVPEGSGSTNQQVTVPDTITEWVGLAVCTHSEVGVGLSEKTSITTFTPFFLDLTLPPSIKRGEILPVKISVFNYVDDALPVTVILGESSEYEILGEATESLCLEAHDMMVHTVRIRPSVIGDVSITVSAKVDYNAGSCGRSRMKISKQDAIIKSIVVEAEGFPREKAWSKYICSDDLADGSDSLESWEVSAPSAAIVEGSDRGWVMVVGDLLALSVVNLGHLIRMPYGCGEQNMLNFAPNIFILQYLDATSQDAPETKQKLLEFMTKGYQRQLLYLRRDGSFSTFGNADETGSTFLTAFVLKSLVQAEDYILIDKKIVNRTKEWLQTSQGENGCYQSIGTLFNKAMRGGVKKDNSSVALTAYVMISLLESGEKMGNPSIAMAASCLKSDSSQDSYVIALKAYAFALANDATASSLIDQLLELSTDCETSMYWELSRYSWRSRSLEVETAGYTILAMLKRNPESYEQQIRKIVKWISSERNGRGGFISTQDTVVALQAMASFESHLDRGDLNAVMLVKTADLSHSFSVDESNKLLRQQVSIPSLPTTVSLNMEGTGCVLMQAVLRYNIPEPEPSDAFQLQIRARTVRDKNCVTKEIDFCTSYLLTESKSNMVVIEVNLVSGYIPVKDDLRKLLKEKVIKRYDIDGGKLSLYVEELTQDQTCVTMRVIREIDVEDAKPGSVVVYDYYQPEFSLSKSYNLPSALDCLYAW